MRPRALRVAGLLLVLSAGIVLGWAGRVLQERVFPPPAPARVPLPAGYGAAVGFDRGVADLDLLGPLWYYDYSFGTPDRPGHPHLLLLSARPERGASAIADVARAHPGHWWILGNEPNDPNQDNLSPAEYARFFVRTAALIRGADPTAGIMSAGIADADADWAQQFVDATVAWSGLPPQVDAWNIHNYLLTTADQYDVAAFTARITRFHAWMATIGQGDRPLVLGEWGVLYGQGCCNRPLDPASKGTAFLDATAAWLETSGLVTAWAWFTLDSGDQRFNGDLLRADRPHTLSAFGEHYRDRVARYPGRAP